jgi:hypothetical protein
MQVSSALSCPWRRALHRSEKAIQNVPSSSWVINFTDLVAIDDNKLLRNNARILILTEVTSYVFQGNAIHRYETRKTRTITHRAWMTKLSLGLIT